MFANSIGVLYFLMQALLTKLKYIAARLFIRPENSGGNWDPHSKRQIGLAKAIGMILRYFVTTLYSLRYQEQEHEE